MLISSLSYKLKYNSHKIQTAPSQNDCESFDKMAQLAPQILARCESILGSVEFHWGTSYLKISTRGLR